MKTILLAPAACCLAVAVRFVYTRKLAQLQRNMCIYNDVIKWKHFPPYWPFVRGIHLSPVNSPHEGQWRGALMFSLICARINGWINNREAGDLRRHRAHYDVTVMRAVINDVLNVDYTNVHYISDSWSSGEKWIMCWWSFIPPMSSHIKRHCF